MVRTFTLPAIPIPFRGRNIYVAGDRTFDDPWTTTFLNDTDFGLRNSLELWSNGINDLAEATGVTAAALVHASKLSIEKGEIEVFTSGGTLNVGFSFDGESFQDVWLKGGANYVFKGELDG